jgi:hypothetical protein
MRGKDFTIATLLVGLLFASCAVAAGCNAIAGITDGVLASGDSGAIEAGDDAGSHPDSTTQGDGTSPDGTTPGDGAGHGDAPDACGLTTCGTACVDPHSDPLNCGQCAHSCLGGSCTDGGCQPVVLSNESPAGPMAIAVDSTRVYWTDYLRTSSSTGSLLSCPKDACDGGTVLYTQSIVGTENQLTGIALSADAGPGTVFIAAFSGNVLAVPTTGGAASTLATGFGVGGITAVAYDPVWGSVYAAGGTSGYEFQADASCDPTTCGQFVIGLQNAYSVAVDTQTVYFSSNVPAASDGGGGVAYGPTNPQQAHKLQAPYLLTDLQSPSSVYSDGNYVWVAVQGTVPSYTDGQIVSCPVGQNCTNNSPPPTVAASSQYQPWSVISDGKRVYWSIQGGGLTGHGQIVSCPISNGGCSGTPTVLVANLDSPGALALDAAAIYWVNGDGRIMKLAKP